MFAMTHCLSSRFLVYILLILFFNPFQSDKDTPRTGNCKKLKSCYPHFKIYDFPASETWVMGLFDTCSYQSARGRQVQKWETRKNLVQNIIIGVWCLLQQHSPRGSAWGTKERGVRCWWGEWGHCGWFGGFPHWSPAQGKMRLQAQKQSSGEASPPAPGYPLQPVTKPRCQLLQSASPHQLHCQWRAGCGSRVPLDGRILSGNLWHFLISFLQAALMNLQRQFCGGSLIDENHILTAAHCVAQ